MMKRSGCKGKGKGSGIISRKTNYKGQDNLPFIFFFTYPKYK